MTLFPYTTLFRSAKCYNQSTQEDELLLCSEKEDKYHDSETIKTQPFCNTHQRKQPQNRNLIKCINCMADFETLCLTDPIYFVFILVNKPRSYWVIPSYICLSHEVVYFCGQVLYLQNSFIWINTIFHRNALSPINVYIYSVH